MKKATTLQTKIAHHRQLVAAAREIISLADVQIAQAQARKKEAAQIESQHLAALEEMGVRKERPRKGAEVSPLKKASLIASLTGNANA